MLVQWLTKLKNRPEVGTRPCKFWQALLGLITPAVNGGVVVMGFSPLKAAELDPNLITKRDSGSLRVEAETVLLPASPEVPACTVC